MEQTLTGKIKIEEIRRGDKFQALFTRMGELWDSCPEATPFQLPEWIIPWCKYFCPVDLLTLAFINQGRLIGLAPLMIEREFGPQKIRRLAFIGTGISDYLDLLALEEYSGEITRSMFQRLFEQRYLWEICHLEEIKPSSRLLHVDYDGFKSEIAPFSVCPVINLPGSVEEFESSLEGEFKSRLKRAKKTLFKMGGVSYEIAGPDNYLEFLNAFFDLHTRWWKEKKNGRGALYGEPIRAFHKEVARGFLARGILRLYGLRFKGEFAAIVYAFASRGRVYSYLGGFDPALERLSPGNLILEYAIKDSIQSGMREFDFLRGAEKYKFMWGAKEESNYIVKLSY